MPDPFFSIIIPTYNRADRLVACLESLSLLKYPSDRFEVIVVDDGSETAPDEIVAGFKERLNINLFSQANAGPAAARNTGASLAKGEYLAFTDDDCVLDQSWLSVVASRVSERNDCAIGGKTINALPHNLYSDASQAIIDSVYAYYNSEPDDARFFASNNLAFPSDRFRSCGGFDPRYRTSEDREICERWLSQGYRLVYAPEAVVYHKNALTFRSFWQQHFHYGRGAFLFRQRNAPHRKQQLKLEPFSFYLRMVLYPFSRTHWWRAVRVFGLILLSQIASAAGFLSQWMMRRDRKEQGLPARRGC